MARLWGGEEVRAASPCLVWVTQPCVNLLGLCVAEHRATASPVDKLSLGLLLPQNLLPNGLEPRGTGCARGREAAGRARGLSARGLSSRQSAAG